MAWSGRTQRANAQQWANSAPVDLEDWANVSIRVEDGSRGTTLTSDVEPGGLSSRVTAFISEGVIKASRTANDAVETYAVDPATFQEEYFTEKLETKAGWNRPGSAEGWFRGFAQEIEDFVHPIRDSREPQAGIDLAVDCVNLIYFAQVSAEQGRRMSLKQCSPRNV